MDKLINCLSNERALTETICTTNKQNLRQSILKNLSGLWGCMLNVFTDQIGIEIYTTSSVPRNPIF